ncbi:MAG TPA: hypothetical protein VFU35_07285, partial [Jatrophihabitans sp.]|nr:hypothetical protein [Jatrophihabitans sp.]
GLGKPERAARMADRSAGSKTLAPRAAPASGPSIEVVGDVIRAGLAFALPDVAVGVFSLQDLAFASTFELSVTGATRPTLTLDFATVENPFRLTVSLIGGGGYLRVRVDTGGLVLVAGALEFGAAVAVNLAGVVAGYASVMGGVYFELAGNDISLTGYLAIKGKLSVLGIVSVAVEVNLALAYDPNSQKVEGRAELAIKIKVFVFKKTVRFEVHKQFAGANSDPSFAEIMAPADWPDPAELPWDTYCTAFAPV